MEKNVIQMKHLLKGQLSCYRQENKKSILSVSLYMAGQIMWSYIIDN